MVNKLIFVLNFLQTFPFITKQVSPSVLWFACYLFFVDEEITTTIIYIHGTTLITVCVDRTILISIIFICAYLFTIRALEIVANSHADIIVKLRFTLTNWPSIRFLGWRRRLLLLSDHFDIKVWGRFFWGLRKIVVAIISLKQIFIRRRSSILV